MNKEQKQHLLTILGIVFAAMLGAVMIMGFYRLAENHKKKEIVKSRGNVEILVLGDSIWDLERGETGIAALLEKELENVTVWNLALTGSRAAGSASYQAGKSLAEGERTYDEGTDNTCLYAMAEYIAGKRQPDIPADTEAAAVWQDVDFDNIDYIVLAYGLNDYFGAVKRKNPDDCYDISTYGGSLCSSIELLRERCPDAELVILSPTYGQTYSYGQVIYESDYHDYGGGTCPDYVATAEEMADAYGYLFVNNYRDLEISIHNGAEYLADATHLTEKGRRAYAKNLASHLLRYWKNEGNNG